MNYSLSHPKNKYLDKTNEISITLPNDFKKLDLKKVIDALLTYENKKINIVITDAENCIKNNGIQMIQAIKNKYPQLNLLLSLPFEEEHLVDLLDMAKFSKLPYMFYCFISEWSGIHMMVNLGVSEIYITDALCFELDKVSSFLHERNIKIRVFPNIAQSKYPIGNNLKAAYICPQDIEIYEPYVDTMEFIYSSKEHEEILYHTYAEKGKWLDKMNLIISDLDSDIDGRFMLPHFAEKRVRCQQNCLKGGPCQLCNRCEEMSAILDKKD